MVEQDQESPQETPPPAAQESGNSDADTSGRHRALDDNAPPTHEALYDVSVELRAILGSTKMGVSNLLRLGRGAVIELDQTVKGDITLTAAGKLIAYGQVVVVEKKIAVKITRLARSDTY